MDIVIRRQSEQLQNKYQENSNKIFHDKKWEWGFLRKQCLNLELEQFYKTYMQRLQRSYLSIFIVIQALVGGIHTILLLTAVENKNDVFPEIFSYLAAILLVWASLIITFREDFIKRRPFVAYIASFIAVLLLVISDLIVPLYHATIDFPIPPLRPTYASYILYAIYIFIPLSENWHAFILGIAVTICYIINFIMVTYRLDDYLFVKTCTEAVFLICVNFFGIYFRLMKEIAIRTTFLDRRECVEENLLLRYVRDQEKSLLLSIIPADTAEDLERDIRERIEVMKADNLHRKNAINASLSTKSLSVKKWRRPDTEKLFITHHTDVSILYADVVNFTYLTTCLKVKPLVETLHELFVKFDQASEEYNCLRIKFLGDCYYCVSGIPDKNIYHAKSCVDLGLRMIRDIREVRTRRKLNIDMRIGVHSGGVWSGVIGACKWQYDIWSKDVDIANRLESTGESGKVHISKPTLLMLDNEYLYEPGTQKARDDEVLKKCEIETFLIKPQKFYINEDNTRQSIGVKRLIENRRTSKPKDTNTNFMQNTIEQYNQIRIQAKLEMSRELDKMPIGKFHLNKFCFGSHKRLTHDEMEEQKFRSNVSTFFLFFKDIRWEFLFLTEPDVMLKYSCLTGLLTFIGILIVQGINKPRGDVFWIVNGIAGSILLCFIILTWYKKLWIVFSNNNITTTDENDDDIENRGRPKKCLSKILYQCSDQMMRNIYLRGLLYVTIVLTLCASSLLELIECHKYETNFNESSTIITDNNFSIATQLANAHKNEHRLCLNTWAITESLVLTICMSFLFVRIPFLFKFFVGLFIVIFYGWIVLNQYAKYYHESNSTNLGLNAEYSHLLIVIISFGIFHLMDRQNEYIAKVDYNWKRQLQKKQEDAEFTKETIKILVQNILPVHVAEIYMAKKMKDELYSEEYENVAIMFASITNYDIAEVGLSVLNGIICDFDEKLISYGGPLKIEKIKVCGWTYMAACGLDPGRCDSTITFPGNRLIHSKRSSTLVNGRNSLHNSVSKRISVDLLQIPNEIENHTKRVRKQSSKNTHNVVYLMTEFALELMKTLQAFNKANWQDHNNSINNNSNNINHPNQEEVGGMLRIGISHGEVMAGVVGSSKPLYDVWGNAVNMASRMDTTGIVGKIQVTEETALVLKSFNIKCEYRGSTYVKGRKYIPTYFVATDENFNFVPETTESDLINNYTSSNSTSTTTTSTSLSIDESICSTNL